MGEKMWCEVILPRNKVKGEIMSIIIYLTLSKHFAYSNNQH